MLSFAEGAHADFRLEGSAVAVTGGSANGHEIMLMSAGDATGATHFGRIGAGPWVLSESGVGLLGFGSRPFTP